MGLLRVKEEANLGREQGHQYVNNSVMSGKGDTKFKMSEWLYYASLKSFLQGFSGILK